jgi:hypothetical protein
MGDQRLSLFFRNLTKLKVKTGCVSARIFGFESLESAQALQHTGLLHWACNIELSLQSSVLVDEPVIGRTLILYYKGRFQRGCHKSRSFSKGISSAIVSMILISSVVFRVFLLWSTGTNG